MNTVSVMVPRDAFIAVCVMSHRKHGTLCRCVSPQVVFMDRRDNGPAMTRLGVLFCGWTARSRKEEVNTFLKSLPRTKGSHVRPIRIS